MLTQIFLTRLNKGIVFYTLNKEYLYIYIYDSSLGTLLQVD